MHFAFIAPPLLSHVRTLEPLATQLIEGRHRVTWVHQADVAGWIQDRRIGFRAVGSVSHPPGSLAFARRAAGPGPFGLRRLIADMAATTDLLCGEVPAVLEQLGVDAIVADQMEAAGGLLGAGLGLPCVSVACALPVNREPWLPLPVMHWAPAVGQRGQAIVDGSTWVYDWLMQAHARVIRHHAARFGLPPRERLADCLSPRLQISQTPAGFDFPRTPSPFFHTVGPLRPPRVDEPALDLALDPGRPFAFASLGTTQGDRFALFLRIVRACRAEGVQVLVAHCGGLDAPRADVLRREGATAVTAFAPQRAALERADVVITHAGLNTVLDALATGTPQLALPITFDQPGVAARVVHAGTGVRLWPAVATRSALRRGLRQLLSEEAFARRCRAFGEEIVRSGGAPRAVALIEAALGHRAGRTDAPAEVAHG